MSGRDDAAPASIRRGPTPDWNEASRGQDSKPARQVVAPSAVSACAGRPSGSVRHSPVGRRLRSAFPSTPPRELWLCGSKPHLEVV